MSLDLTTAFQQMIPILTLVIMIFMIITVVKELRGAFS